MRSLLKLRIFILPYWRQLAISLVALLLMTASQLVIPEIIGQVIDVGLANRDTGFILSAAGLVLGIGLFRSVFAFFQRYLSAWIAHNVSFDLRNRLYEHIQRLSFTFHDQSQTGNLISRVIEDVRSTNQFTGFGLIELVRIVLLVAGITLLMVLTNPTLTLIGMIPMLPLVLVTTQFGKRIHKLFYIVDQSLGDLSARLQENVTGAQVVRAFAREPYEIDRFDEANRTLYDTQVNVFKEFARVFPTTHFLVTFGTILILWFGGQMVLTGELTIGELVAFNAYLLLMAQPAQQLTWTVNMAGEAAAGIDRIFEILDHAPAIRSPKNPVRLKKITGRVSFDHVSFKYDGETQYALRDIDLEVEPNQIIALIGPTGSGKTSLINLIPRFYDVAEGRILIDGQDVRDLDLDLLRRQIGIVLQTSLLFSDRVRENIAFGRPEADLEEITAAAEAAQAHSFITEMEEGYETIVGERGITLSGGQRQRVAIARALLMNPRILILDDSTSSVDTETEHLIQRALDEMMVGRTTFVIAHRLSTVRRADLILVLDKGKIVQRGSHEQLLEEEGLYREIYDLQLRDQEEFAEEMRAPAD